MNAEIGDPALSLALALVAGLVAQVAARHLRLPGIVLLLAAGVLLGPDLLAVVDPSLLGETLHVLVGFAVAVILFEGGLNLDLARLRRERLAIRQLVTLGAVVTAVGGALAARWILGWSWTLSVLFGTLVIVTGPTVITPLLRRIRLKPAVATVLEAEGVLIDAIGAIVAVVTLEVVLNPIGESLPAGLLDLAGRIGFGVLAGLAAGGLIAFLLRFEAALPEGLENVFTLSLVLGVFQISNHLLGESGLMTVTVAGITVGNVRHRKLNDLKDFKEQLTVMLIGLLFVLLAADVRLDEVRSLGWPGVWTVAALMFVVRPLNALVGTAGSKLGPRERLFIAWLAPRGIVAAAVSSVFARQLDNAGIEGGAELRALVFLVIAATVLIQGLSGGPLARLLGLRLPGRSGFAILGAGPLARAVAELLHSGGHRVVVMDSNPYACRLAEERGLRVVFGNALEERAQLQADLESRSVALGLTANDELNFMFCRRARENYKVPEVRMAQRGPHSSVTREMRESIGARLLFGEPRRGDLWALRLERELAALSWWRYTLPADGELRPLAGDHGAREHASLPLAVHRNGALELFDRDTVLQEGDLLAALVLEEQRSQAEAWLRERGLEPALPPAAAGSP